jgi:ubiquinone/menaquinone biosynthesis C-methylase UbiE
MQLCPSCSNKSDKIFKYIDNHKLIICDRCGLLFTDINERDRLLFIQKQYSNKYITNYANQLARFNRRFKKYLSLINQYKPEGNLLDAGCGTGFFLKYVKERSHFKPFGMEPNEELRKIAKINTRSSIVNGTLDKMPYKDNFFDVVTCLDVLEHSIRLNKNVSELKRVLKPGGLLLLQVPNYKSFMAIITGDKWDWWSVPDHILHFSFEFITQYMQKMGFTLVKSFSYQDSKDFIINTKGVFKKNVFRKVLFIMLLPVFYLLEFLSGRVRRGGLSLILLKKT